MIPNLYQKRSSEPPKCLAVCMNRIQTNMDLAWLLPDQQQELVQTLRCMVEDHPGPWPEDEDGLLRACFVGAVGSMYYAGVFDFPLRGQPVSLRVDFRDQAKGLALLEEAG
mgnify:CR=1 FL=1